jgi:hypothetical protein
LLAAGAIGAGVIGMTGAAAAENERGGVNPPAKIKIKLNDEGPFFQGPDSIDKGSKLTIVNRTDPKDVGPHTFTLVKKGPKPFERILAAHEAGPPPDFPIGKQSVDSGKKGWDRPFTENRDGDSWYTETKGESHSRKVKAKVGKTLRYFCAVHPFMKGKFEVE